MKQPIDVLIVGQGISGSCLALQLLDRGKNIFIIDRGHETATSQIAAGLINPVTGRRYSKSWMIDTLLPFARQFYRDLQNQVEPELYKHTPIHRILGSSRAINTWDGRSGDPDYAEYLSDEHPEFSFIDGSYTAGTVTGGMHIYMNRLINYLRKKWMDQHILRREVFDYEALKRIDSIWKYKNLTARRIVFSEGPAVVNNPYFRDFPWDPIKGEALYLNVKPGLLNAPLKQKLFLIPWEEDTIWAGTTYDRDHIDGQPSEEGKQYLLDQLETNFNFDYELLDHFAANRPTVHDHRPIIGEHPEHQGLYSFNGMGTKGASLAPWFSSELCRHIFQNEQLLPAVDLNRFTESS